MEIDTVTWYHKDNKTVLLQIIINGDKNATKRFKSHISKGMSYLMINSILKNNGFSFDLLEHILNTIRLMQIQFKNYDHEYKTN